jgi:glycerophosphoryl diester phosphodiesterase
MKRMGPGQPVVIAHRGASGYLPEHTLAGKAMAHAMGADFLEQDVVATRDGELVVLHDLALDCVTDVASKFPGRARPDGHYYCIDFTLAELRTLSLIERQAERDDAYAAQPPTGQGRRFPGRFPVVPGLFGIVTFEEELTFIAGLNHSTGRVVGIYPEIKDPQWHREQGVDIAPRFLRTLERFGYRTAHDPVFVQCFDPAELRRLRESLGCKLPLVQLLEGSGSGGSVPTRAELGGIAGYANGIGPSISLIARRGDGGLALTSLVDDAHAEGLRVHPYTFRRDELPRGFGSFDELLQLLLVELRVDGLFTDFPDLAAQFIAAHRGALAANSGSGQR